MLGENLRLGEPYASFFSLSSHKEERVGERRPFGTPLSGSTAIELRSADFSPPRSGPAKTAGSGLKSALLSCRDSLNSITLNRYSHPNVFSVVGTSRCDVRSACSGATLWNVSDL